MRRLGVLVTAVGLLLGPTGAVGAGEDPLRQSREAAERLRFTALVTVRWVDAVGDHRTTLHVSSDQGQVRIDGQLWPSGPTDLALPAAGDKYDLRTAPGPTVGARPTTAVEVWMEGELRERLAVDDATGLVLLREQFGPTGEPVRVVTVDQLDVAAAGDVGPPDRVVNDLVRPTAPRGLPRLYRAPAELPGGYLRLAAYQRGALVHLLYSDGLHGVSVFAQPGRLDPRTFPAGGRRVQVGRRTAWAYAWPGGEALTWQAGGVVYTLVGDGPDEELAAVAASWPSPPRPSFASRLKRSCRAMAELLVGR